jgi:hypothetical protein
VPKQLFGKCSPFIGVKKWYSMPVHWVLAGQARRINDHKIVLIQQQRNFQILCHLKMACYWWERGMTEKVRYIMEN